MIPTFASPGVITPGQLGPIRRQSYALIYSRAFTISLTGIPSVIQMMTLIPASAASIIASAAITGGTKMIDTSAPVTDTASLTVLKTGRSRWVVPPFPGVTPPTTGVPYSIICDA